ncbi:MAG: hypothetical protein O2894_01855 [Planctomycetota bacterium]|nr:hypothetical protein [Planctomycetota bacterium]
MKSIILAIALLGMGVLLSGCNSCNPCEPDPCCEPVYVSPCCPAPSQGMGYDVVGN